MGELILELHNSLYGSFNKSRIRQKQKYLLTQFISTALVLPDFDRHCFLERTQVSNTRKMQTKTASGTLSAGAQKWTTYICITRAGLLMLADKTKLRGNTSQGTRTRLIRIIPPRRRLTSKRASTHQRARKIGSQMVVLPNSWYLILPSNLQNSKTSKFIHSLMSACWLGR